MDSQRSEKVLAETEKRKGSVFYVLLPVINQMIFMKEDVDVILVDDDRDICIMVEAILRFAGFKVLSCPAPDQLDETLAHTHPRLLLMDMLLSGIDGRDVCRRLKADPATSQIRVMMMSAHPDADKSCREAQADDFISKPFDMDFFIARVKDQLALVNS